MANPTTYKHSDDIDPETGEPRVQAPAPDVASSPDAPVNMTQAQFAAAMGEAIAKGVSEGMAANAPVRKMTFGEYSRTAHNPFHPQGKAKIPKLARIYMQNGWILPVDTLHDDEITLLNQITHSGRYIDRRVEVIVNTDSAEESVNIRFSNKIEAAMELKGYARNFKEILQLVVEAQIMEDLESEERSTKQVKSRQFGSSKQSQAAREAAAARG